MFAEKEVVEFNGPLEGFKEVDGLMRVEVVEEDRGLVLVRLPAEAFEIGYFVTVNGDQIQKRTAKLEA